MTPHVAGALFQQRPPSRLSLDVAFPRKSAISLSPPGFLAHLCPGHSGLFNGICTCGWPMDRHIPNTWRSPARAGTRKNMFRSGPKGQNMGTKDSKINTRSPGGHSGPCPALGNAGGCPGNDTRCPGLSHVCRALCFLRLTRDNCTHGQKRPREETQRIKHRRENRWLQTKSTSLDPRWNPSNPRALSAASSWLRGENLHHTKRSPQDI